MTLEEIQKLNNYDLEELLAEKVLGWQRYFRGWEKAQGSAGILQPPNQNLVHPNHLEDIPKFCTDLNLIAAAEKFFIEKEGFIKYKLALYEVLDLKPIGLSDFLIRHLWLATARQRAEAILLALQD